MFRQQVSPASGIAQANMSHRPDFLAQPDTLLRVFAREALHRVLDAKRARTQVCTGFRLR
jgi:hypothetical protein